MILADDFRDLAKLCFAIFSLLLPHKCPVQVVILRLEKTAISQRSRAFLREAYECYFYFGKKKTGRTLVADLILMRNWTGKKFLLFLRAKVFALFLPYKNTNVKKSSRQIKRRYFINHVIIHISEPCYVGRSPGRYLFKRLFC